ncbi:exonuclease 1-like [Penaeus chinensis]|uniref:exonuclease 1-like n=1 Tax=Penaeus chinensis TaxID=139456 RepID=UPI001FB6883B|nr:exonuclease 1-like [Penaeus chinensis]
MGIQGLLPFLKKASRAANLRDFKGQTVAVDAYCWLHKGAFSCADKLVRGEPTDGYVLYIMKQVNQLLSYGIKPILVFDGCHLPSKAITEKKRRENREKNRKKAKELLREGKAKEARECFQRCVDITSEMAADTIKACRARNIDVIVAPYEADSQLAYLNLSGIAQLIITEDSDLILFGCKKVLFKMDNNGGGILVEQEQLHVSMNMPRDKFTFDKFINMCILSGCDYLPSLHGIGLAKACKFFSITTNPDIHNVLCKLPSYLKMPHLEVTKEYRDGFMQAKNTFLYQLVFDPVERTLRPLQEYPEGKGPEDYPYAGRFVGHERALQIALGNVNVQTGEKVDDFCPETYVPPEPKSSGWDKRGDICTAHRSIWSRDFTPSKVVPAVPSILGGSEKQSTLGKELLVSSTPVLKRKFKPEPVPDDDGFPTEDELQDLYGLPAKRKKEEAPVDSYIADEDIAGKTALDHLSEGLDFEEEKVKMEVGDLSPELKTESPSAKSNRSKNPFAKAKSPIKPAGQFSALKRFTKIRKSLEKSNTVVQSRYFAKAVPSATNNQGEKKSEEEEKPEPKALDGEVIDHQKVKLESELQIKTEDEKIPSESHDELVKAPLSPVINNIQKNNKNSTFKWGKLSDKFGFKDKVKIESSPSTKYTFKAVTKTPSTRETDESKENAVSLSQKSDPRELPLSQSSLVSEASAVSDVGSIDNESFGLTPTPEMSAKCDKDSEVASPPSITSAMPSQKTLLSNKGTKNRGRAVGLSRPSGANKKNTDKKQLSLKDMFGFKKDAPKLH